MISILMPAKNVERTLDRAISSIVDQTFTDWELIVVDDGSTDDTPEILKAWSQKDSRIRIVHQPSGGIVIALQRAAKEAERAIFARMDADDVSATDRFERQLQLLKENPHLGVVSCKVAPLHDTDNEQTTDGMAAYLEWVNGLLDHDSMARERFIESPIPHPSVMMRREAYEAVGGYRDNGLPEDYDLWLRMFEKGVQFGKVDAELYFWNDRPDRASRTDPRYSLESFQRCKALHLVNGPLKDDPRFYLWGAGKYGKQILRLLLEYGKRPEALIDIDPRKIGKRVPNERGGAPVISAEDLAVARAALVLAAVGSRGSDRARKEIRDAVASKGYMEGDDFFLLA